jgi:hypothetical protein
VAQSPPRVYIDRRRRGIPVRWRDSGEGTVVHEDVCSPPAGRHLRLRGPRSEPQTGSRSRTAAPPCLAKFAPPIGIHQLRFKRARPRQQLGVKRQRNVVDTGTDEPHPDDLPNDATVRGENKDAENHTAEEAGHELRPDHAPMPQRPGRAPHVQSSQASNVDHRHDQSLLRKPSAGTARQNRLGHGPLLATISERHRGQRARSVELGTHLAVLVISHTAALSSPSLERRRNVRALSAGMRRLHRLRG